jgi:flagellar basal body rod protein FlgF
MLGVMGIFGLAVAELLTVQKEVENLLHQSQLNRKIAEDAEREAEIIIREARSRADSILVDAERESVEMINRKREIEMQLKEFLKTEKELIKKYEAD